MLIAGFFSSRSAVVVLLVSVPVADTGGTTRTCATAQAAINQEHEYTQQVDIDIAEQAHGINTHVLKENEGIVHNGKDTTSVQGQEVQDGLDGDLCRAGKQTFGLLPQHASVQGNHQESRQDQQPWNVMVWIVATVTNRRVVSGMAKGYRCTPP